jgi:hypothetical protein
LQNAILFISQHSLWLTWEMFMYNQSYGGLEVKNEPYSSRFSKLAELKSYPTYKISLHCFLNDECFMKELGDDRES